MNSKSKKYLFLFLVFGSIYFVIETIYKGQLTHWTMFTLAGLIGVIIGGLNEYIPWEMPFIMQCFIGMCIATIGEGLSGLVLNVWLNLNIWDYSRTPFNFFFHQCCLPFCVVWFILSGVCIVLDDYIRWKYFGEEYPRYYLL